MSDELQEFMDLFNVKLSNTLPLNERLQAISEYQAEFLLFKVIKTKKASEFIDNLRKGLYPKLNRATGEIEFIKV